MSEELFKLQEVHEEKVVQEVKPKKTQKNGNGKRAELNPFKAETFEDFTLAVGKEVTMAEVNEAMSRLKVATVYGEMDMASFDRVVVAKLYEYVRYGIARKVWKMMQKQDSNTTTDDLLTILLEMARLEVEFGLRPLTHVIPVTGQTYVKADGFLYYAKNSGNLKSITWQDEEKDGAWTSTCRVETTDSAVYEGVATVQPTRNYMDDPREKARTKAMRRALRRAFPIGASDENFDEFEKMTWNEAQKIAGDLRELAQKGESQS